ncbi:MAG: hypothetical protein ACOC46_04465 [Pirellulales bacterium]
MPPRLILAARSGFWAATMRAELAEAGLRLHEAGTLEAAWRQLDEAPASFVIAELTRPNAARLVDCLFNLSRVRPRARAAVVAARALADYAGLMREAGAVHFTCNPRRLGPLIDAACRHLAAAPAEVPASLTDRIWSTLPWAKSPWPPAEA